VNEQEGIAQLRQIGATLDAERIAGNEQLAARYRGRSEAMQLLADVRQRRLAAYT